MNYSLPHLLRSDYDNWTDYYFHYQFTLADRYYIPLLKLWGIHLPNISVLDVGCGDGGFTSAIAADGVKCTGVETRQFPWRQTDNTRFIQADITQPDAPNLIGENYDLIVLRDVIEHIPLLKKKEFLSSLRNFSKESTRILITFPPFYSAYGLHQQTLMKSRARLIPWLGLLPGRFVERIARISGESIASRADLGEIRESRMTISQFHRLLTECQLEIEQSLFFTIRPSHQIRYGWPMTESPLGSVPLLREIFIMGTAYLLSFSENVKSSENG